MVMNIIKENKMDNLIEKIEQYLEENNPYIDDKKIRELYKNLMGKPTKVRIRDMGGYKVLRVGKGIDTNTIAVHRDGGLTLQIVTGFNKNLYSKVLKELKRDFVVEKEDFSHGELWVVFRKKTGKSAADVEKEMKLPKTSNISLKEYDIRKAKTKKDAMLIVNNIRKVLKGRKVKILQYDNSMKGEVVASDKAKTCVLYKMISPFEGKFFVNYVGTWYYAADNADGMNLLRLLDIENVILRELETMSWSSPEK